MKKLLLVAIAVLGFTYSSQAQEVRFERPQDISMHGEVLKQATLVYLHRNLDSIWEQ